MNSTCKIKDGRRSYAMSSKNFAIFFGTQNIFSSSSKLIKPSQFDTIYSLINNPNFDNNKYSYKGDLDLTLVYISNDILELELNKCSEHNSCNHIHNHCPCFYCTTKKKKDYTLLLLNLDMFTQFLVLNGANTLNFV